MESNIFESKPPSRISVARRLRMGATGWGALPFYHVEFIKVHSFRGKARSTAVITVADALGKVNMFLEGDRISALFDLSSAEWKEIEKLVSSDGELFYRPFKNGLSDRFSEEQKFFYSFCQQCLYRDLLFVSFKRVPNMRKGEKTTAFLKVLDCVKPNARLTDLYYKVM